jgi:small-conductance mechanosensitive channel
VWTLVFGGMQCLVFYAAVWALHPEHMASARSSPAWWVSRIFAAILLFICIRIFDHIVVVPLLTRRGKIRLQRLVHQIILAIIYIFSLLIFLSLSFGLNINKFLAGSAVISIVLGLALQETLGNFFSGMVMQASSPFNLGDWVACGGVEGRVVDMTWRAVTLLTLDDNHVLIPNSVIARDRITNYAAPTTSTARTIKLGIDYPSPPDQVREVLLAAMHETPGVLKDPPPVVFLTDFGDSSIEYTLKFRISDPARHLLIENHVRMQAWYRVREAGMSFPFPIRTVEMVDTTEAKRSADERILQQRIATLRKVRLLSPFTDEEIALFASQAVIRLFEAGETIYRQGDDGNSLMVISTGRLELSIEGDTGRVHDEILNPGDCVGEFSACLGGPRAGTVRVLQATTCLEIPNGALQRVFTGNAGAMEKLSGLIVERHEGRIRLLNELKLSEDDRATNETLYNSLLGRMKKFFNYGA